MHALLETKIFFLIKNIFLHKQYFCNIFLPHQLTSYLIKTLNKSCYTSIFFRDNFFLDVDFYFEGTGHCGMID